MPHGPLLLNMILVSNVMFCPALMVMTSEHVCELQELKAALPVCVCVWGGGGGGGGGGEGLTIHHHFSVYHYAMRAFIFIARLSCFSEYIKLPMQKYSCCTKHCPVSGY